MYIYQVVQDGQPQTSTCKILIHFHVHSGLECIFTACHRLPPKKRTNGFHIPKSVVDSCGIFATYIF